MGRRTKFTRLSAGAALLLGALLAGCTGGAGGTGAGGSSPASAAVSTKAAKPNPPAVTLRGEAYTNAQLADCRAHLDVTATATAVKPDQPAPPAVVTVTPPATKVAAEQALAVFSVTPNLAHWETKPDLVICFGTAYLSPGNIEVPLEPGRTVAGYGPGRGTTITKVVLQGHLTLVKRGQGG